MRLRKVTLSSVSRGNHESLHTGGKSRIQTKEVDLMTCPRWSQIASTSGEQLRVAELNNKETSLQLERAL